VTSLLNIPYQFVEELKREAVNTSVYLVSLSTNTIP